MALFFAVQLGLGVIVLGYFGYYFARGHFIHGTEEIINTEIRYLSAMDESALAEITSKPPANRILMLTTENGDFIAGNIQELPQRISVLAEGSLLLTLDDATRYAARFHSFDDGRRLLVGVDVTETIKNYNFMLGLCLLGIVLMLVVIVTSFFISTFVVSRTNRIAATAKNIMDTGNLSERITIDSKWDDLSYVSQVLNAFLARTEALIDDVQRVSDNIAHDLRTPLTRLRNNLEKIKTTDVATATELIAEADHLLSIFNALLRISRIETAQQRISFAKVSLDAVLRDAVDLYEPIAEEKNITIKTSFENCDISGDRDLLFQMFANLLDNAIKFSPRQTSIDVTLRATGGHALCSIRDQGQGIAEHEKNKVFNRFYRSDESRHLPGSGLGLSMIAAIIELHNGTIRLDDANPGLCVEISFKKQ